MKLAILALVAAPMIAASYSWDSSWGRSKVYQYSKADCSFEIENGDFDYTSDKHCLVDANLKSVRSSDEHAMLCLVSYLPENYEQKQSNISNRGKANCKGEVVASVKFTKDSCQEITTGDKYHYMVVPQTDGQCPTVSG